MKYKTFIRLVWLGAICLVGLIGYGVTQLNFRVMWPVAAPPVQQPAPTPAPAPQPAPTAAPAPAPEKALTTPEMRAKLEDWLTLHGDRNGMMRWNDIFPTSPHRVNALRFREADAAKFSNDPRQWSQFHIDLDRDGVDDEKWLLKNGRTYKREVLDRGGRTVRTEYFNK